MLVVKTPNTHKLVPLTEVRAHGAFFPPVYKDVISRRPLLTRVLEWVQSVRSGLVFFPPFTPPQMKWMPRCEGEAHREADEKVHLLRLTQPGSVAVNRR